MHPRSTRSSLPHSNLSGLVAFGLAVGLATLLGLCPAVVADEDAAADTAAEDAADSTTPPGPPAWAIEQMERSVGIWVTDNSAYRGEREPHDAYGLDWRWAPGAKSLVGRLYGLRGGEESGTFWEFRLFWHPGTRELRVLQFGTGGAYGEGTARATGETTTEVVQDFWAPGGMSWRGGHRETHEGDRRTSSSFAIDADGTWTPQRTYVWVRQTARAEPEQAEDDSY